MIAGPDGPAERVRIHDTPGPRWFPEGSPIRRVHADASMFVGGLRALLLQSLHPLAMAGVAQHSNYRGDPWGRLQRTSTFLAVTTFGAADDAQRAVDRVRGHPPAGARDLLGRPALPRHRSASAGMGARRRSRQLPARPPALWRRPARPEGPRRRTSRRWR